MNFAARKKWGKWPRSTRSVTSKNLKVGAPAPIVEQRTRNLNFMVRKASHEAAGDAKMMFSCLFTLDVTRIEDLQEHKPPKLPSNSIKSCETKLSKFLTNLEGKFGHAHLQVRSTSTSLLLSTCSKALFRWHHAKSFKEVLLDLTIILNSLVISIGTTSK